MVEYVHEAKPAVIEQDWRTGVKIALVGAVVGVLVWGIGFALQKYVLQSMLCDGAAVCGASVTYAGNIAAVIAAVIAVVALVRMSVFRPLLIVLGAVLSLWGLMHWTSDMTIVLQIAVSAGLYALLYSVYAWVARLRAPVIMLIVCAIVVALTRVAPLLV